MRTPRIQSDKVVPSILSLYSPQREVIKGKGLVWKMHFVYVSST